jgi:hypothetical protein
VTYDASTVCPAIAAKLAAIDPTVSVFDTPPSTLNAPAYVVSYERRVDFDQAAFAVDRVEQLVLAVAGLGERYRVNTMLNQAKTALAADQTLGGIVGSLKVTTAEHYHQLGIGGADFLAADLILEITTR